MEAVLTKTIQEKLLPEYPIKYVCYSERWLGEHHKKNHMRPGILAKLILVHLFLQGEDEPHKA